MPETVATWGADGAYLGSESCFEWPFVAGQPAAVVHVPTLAGHWEAIDLLRGTITDPMARKIARAILEMGIARLDETEPTTTQGARV